LVIHLIIAPSQTGIKHSITTVFAGDDRHQPFPPFPGQADPIENDPFPAPSIAIELRMVLQILTTISSLSSVLMVQVE
jgi:hypothetical protein